MRLATSVTSRPSAPSPPATSNATELPHHELYAVECALPQAERPLRVHFRRGRSMRVAFAQFLPATRRRRPAGERSGHVVADDLPDGFTDGIPRRSSPNG